MSITGFNINGNVEKYDYNSLDNTPDISGGSSEEWVELLNTTLAEDVAYIDIVAPDGKKLKKLHIYISTNSAGLSAASKISILATSSVEFNGSNTQRMTVTSSTINTWNYPVFIIEKGALFPIVFSSQGNVNGYSSSAIYMGGVGQNNRYNQYNIGPWKTIRIQPETADVIFKAGVKIYAWGVYE